MPKSRGRRKEPFTPPPAPVNPASQTSPVWLVPVMLACFLLGLVWLVVFYIAGQDVPGMSSLQNYNLLVGFALILVGFVLATRWK